MTQASPPLHPTTGNEDTSTRDRVLGLVLEQGPVCAADVAEELELTSAAVRRHIGALEAQGLIAVQRNPGTTTPRRGRPARHYVATDAGRAEFTDAYSDLAGQVLDFLVEKVGTEAADEFADRRVGELERRYAAQLEGTAPGQERVQALAEALTADGYAATVRKVGDKEIAVQLCQGHCPVQDVAEAFPQLCEAETRAFSRLLGVHVQRLATLASGGYMCTTHVPLALPTRQTPHPTSVGTEGHR
ncbi:helix-turn-helix transcriptional regulator [Georgenia sp. Z1344]|uniref:helix-turn-helix transcriptional regulator n=1 Tax=Georgenia sp. Z1344 TaxID=3416706 RepID=UPI003CF8DC37